MLHGIMLAAGESTRLPNKALLPIAGGMPCIMSGLGLLKRSGAQRITIVISPDSCIPQVLKGLYDDSLEYVVQPKALGVPDALSQLKGISDDDTLMVTFCDNVFVEEECIPWGICPSAAVREMSPSNHQLDGWTKVNKCWVLRTYYTPLKLAGWYVIKGEHLLMVESPESSIVFLNSIEAEAMFINHPWWDIGTMNSYKEYWREHSLDM